MSIETRVRDVIQFGRVAQSFVLLILGQGPSYGYQIRQRLQDEFGYQRASTDPGALYRLLRELEASGVIHSHWNIGESGPARRYYELTDDGHEQLKLEAERLRRQAKRIERFFEIYAEMGA